MLVTQKAQIPYSGPTRKEGVDGYVTTGVTSISRHLTTIVHPFFLDVGQMTATYRVGIQFHMVSYCSAIKAIVFKLQLILLIMEVTEK